MIDPELSRESRIEAAGIQAALDFDTLSPETLALVLKQIDGDDGANALIAFGLYSTNPHRTQHSIGFHEPARRYVEAVRRDFIEAAKTRAAEETESDARAEADAERADDECSIHGSG